MRLSAILVAICALTVLAGNDDAGCGAGTGVTPAKSLCKTTGGTWEEGSCPPACWPPACGQALPVPCAAVCGKQPVCVCPSSAPYWEDGKGCLTPSDCPPPPGCPSASQLELDVLALVNQERATAGAAALLCDANAASAARAFSQYMCDEGFFDHTGPDGSTVQSRLTDAGVQWAACGENIAAGQSTAASVMQSWMNSPGHKSNILFAPYTHLGVGYAACDSGWGFYWTQDFFIKK
jgi:uncharacterized protein YkwD